MIEFKEYCEEPKNNDFRSDRNYDRSKSVRNVKLLLKAKKKKEESEIKHD